MVAKTFLAVLKSLARRAKSFSVSESQVRKLAEKNSRLKKYRESEEKKNLELAELKSELSRAREATGGLGYSRERTPVFFVVGRAKSGTSWLMRLLDAHPEVMCKGEGRFFGRNFFQRDLEQARKGRIQPSSLHRAILEADYIKAWIEKSVWTRGDDMDEHLTNLTRVVANYFLTQRLMGSDKKIVGDKTPFLGAGMIGEIGEIYPDARVIHIIRDGRDTSVSIIHHRWNNGKNEGGIYELNPRELAKRDAYREDPKKLIESGEGIFTEKTIRAMAINWKEQVSRGRQDGRSFLGANYTEVKYEDLLERPEKEAGRLFGFLGATIGEETVRTCVSSASFEQWSKGRKRGEEDSSSFFRKGVAGDWRTVFTEQDRRIFKEAAGDLLIELGYEEDNDW